MAEENSVLEREPEALRAEVAETRARLADNRHPWLIVGGTLLLGWVVGSRLGRPRR